MNMKFFLQRVFFKAFAVPSLNKGYELSYVQVPILKMLHPRKKHRHNIVILIFSPFLQSTNKNNIRRSSGDASRCVQKNKWIFK